MVFYLIAYSIPSNLNEGFSVEDHGKRRKQIFPKLSKNSCLPTQTILYQQSGPMPVLVMD